MDLEKLIEIISKILESLANIATKTTKLGWGALVTIFIFINGLMDSDIPKWFIILCIFIVWLIGISIIIAQKKSGVVEIIDR